MKAVIFLLFVMSSLAAAEEAILFRDSRPGDKAQYFLLSHNVVDGAIQTLHKRISEYSTGYTKTEIDCLARQYRVIGYSEISPQAIQPISSSRWTDLVPESSKSDLVNFVCWKYLKDKK